MMRSAIVSVLMMLSVSAAYAAEVTWSEKDESTSPKGSVRFHGPFSNQTVRATAATGEAHDFVEISFDLLILRSWDGSIDLGPGKRPESVGPDFIRVALGDGRTLLFNTFSNTTEEGFRDDSKFQNYPSPVPGVVLPARTGAAQNNTMGFNYPWPGTPALYPMDATYRIHFIVPHSANEVTVVMQGMGLQDIIDESWGVKNLRIKTVAASDVKVPSKAEIAAAFSQALDPKAVDAMQAFQALISGMGETVAWLRENVKPQPLDLKAVQQKIIDFAADDEHLDERDAANSALREMGPVVEPFLRDARRNVVGEVRQRIDWTLEGIAVTAIGEAEAARVVLATRVLEIIATPEALALRKQLVAQ